MGENQERRQARRQKRGVLRVEEILQAAGTLFAEHGYDRVTTNMIATHADISPGSLYQFFPNKEAITLAFATKVTEQLHQVYGTILSSEAITLPFKDFLGIFIDRIVAFNQENPGYLAIELGSTFSPPLALILRDLHQGILGHLDAMMAAYWPQSTQEHRRLPLLISHRLFLALLPLILQGNSEQKRILIQEMKIVLYRYWKPIIGKQGGEETN